MLTLSTTAILLSISSFCIMITFIIVLIQWRVLHFVKISFEHSLTSARNVSQTQNIVKIRQYLVLKLLALHLYHCHLLLWKKVNFNPKVTIDSCPLYSLPCLILVPCINLFKEFIKITFYHLVKSERIWLSFLPCVYVYCKDDKDWRSK